MSLERMVVVWRNRRVGWIESPVFEFPGVYGRWVPDEEEPMLREFLVSLRQACASKEGEIEVTVVEERKVRMFFPADIDTGRIEFRFKSSESG